MLINLLILILLIWAFLVGYSRGLVLQALYSLGIIISAIIAFLNYKELASKLTMWVPFSSATADSRLLFLIITCFSKSMMPSMLVLLL